MDDKRFLRQWKRQLKLAGNKKRRRFLKDLTVHPDDFEFGDESTAELNVRVAKAKTNRKRRDQDEDKWGDEFPAE